MLLQNELLKRFEFDSQFRKTDNFHPHRNANMNDPRETWQRLQNSLQKSGRGGYGGLPGPGGKFIVGGVLAGLGAFGIYNSLFNGKFVNLVYS